VYTDKEGVQILCHLSGKSLFGEECNGYWFILQSACRSDFVCISVICMGVLLSASRDNFILTL